MALVGVEVAPYWNVNNDIDIVKYNNYIVEVAPYWNVNEVKEESKIKVVKSRSSSILECK